MDEEQPQPTEAEINQRTTEMVFASLGRKQFDKELLSQKSMALEKELNELKARDEQKLIKELKTENASLKSQIEKLQARIQELEK